MFRGVAANQLRLSGGRRKELLFKRMNLAQAVEKFRPAILNEQEPDIETLKCMAELVELNYYEWSKVPDNDEANQKWADFLLKMAKQLIGFA